MPVYGNALLHSDYVTDDVAIESLKRILDAYAASRFAPYAAYYLGQSCLANQKYEDSTMFFEMILQGYRDFAISADVRFQLSLAYNATGKREQAKECLKELISKEPCDLAATRAKDVLREPEEMRLDDRRENEKSK